MPVPANLERFLGLIGKVPECFQMRATRGASQLVTPTSEDFEFFVLGFLGPSPLQREWAITQSVTKAPLRRLLRYSGYLRLKKDEKGERLKILVGLAIDEISLVQGRGGGEAEFSEISNILK